MVSSYLPKLGITMGYPGGIGPEITAKALSIPEIYEICRPLVIGDVRVVEDVLRFCALPLKIHPVCAPLEGLYEYGTIDVLHVANMPLEQLAYKVVTPEQGKASFDYIIKAIDLALKGEIDGTVTAPISKEALNKAGIDFPGHTEIYAKLTGTVEYAMMLVLGNFRVVHVSTHVSLKEACFLVKKDRIVRVIDLTFNALRKLGISNPIIGVAGLNPHCGEDGMFGNEELEEIIPAIQEAARSGKRVEGPIPADTVFPKMRGGFYDAVVVMYHDQGHIPIKLIGFQFDQNTATWSSMSGVNVTLGLPIVRTSVDHGTAFGKAGEGRANPQSMIDAIRMAAFLARRR